MEKSVTFKFSYKADSGKDVLGKTRANSLEEAQEYFAKVKQLPLEEFKSIFIVEVV